MEVKDDNDDKGNNKVLSLLIIVFVFFVFVGIFLKVMFY